MGVPFQAGLATSADHGGRCVVQFPVGVVHLLNDSFRVGRPIYKSTGSSPRYGFNETAKSVGFKDGDVLLSADGVPFERYDGDMLSQIADAREVSVLRDGAKASVYIPDDMMQRLLADSIRFASFRFPYVVDSVMVNSPAAQAGIQPGDSIIALNGTPISFSDFKQAMAERKRMLRLSLKTA